MDKMAFINKVTNMKRCAVINNCNGDIEYEGVNIEGTIILKQVGTDALLIRSDTDIFRESRYEDIYDFCEMQGNCLFIYQDDTEDSKHCAWIPRESSTIKYNKELDMYVYNLEGE